jgi:carbohydrate-selective porin OprB
VFWIPGTVTGHRTQFTGDWGGAEKLRSGQSLRGIGIFGRAGYSPEATNPVTSYASVALIAHGLFNGREYDSFGAGFFTTRSAAI